MSTEKEQTTVAPDYVSSGSDHAHHNDTKHTTTTAAPHARGQNVLDQAYGDDFGVKREASFMTRNGLNFESFKKRSSGDGIVELDRSMKKRHLHMIAIGKSHRAAKFEMSWYILTVSRRWFHWSWFLRRFWFCFRQRWSSFCTYRFRHYRCHDVQRRLRSR